MIELNSLVYALLGGVLPALLWLYFWLHEDKKHPEPKGLIGRTFFLGMVAVILVLPFQKAVNTFLPGMILPAVILWALFEEVFKFGAAYVGGLRSTEDNEPIDPIIYMITAALGFVALENTLFILAPLIGEDIPGSFVTGNLRFIGASLLHVVTSGFIGVALGLNFYKSQEAKRRSVWRAIFVAIVFHTIFNMFIIHLGNVGTLLAFLTTWLGVIYLIWAFEKTKTIAPHRL